MKKGIHKRSMVQAVFFLIAIGVTINHTLQTYGTGLSWLSSGYIHYVCPICGVTTIYQFFASSLDLMTKLQNPVTYVIMASIILAIIAGPIFCGWICPFGTFQDIIGELIGTRVSKKQYNKRINPKLDAGLRWLRYVSLLLVLYMTAKSAITLLESVNPYHALLNLFVGEFAVIGLIVLAVVVLASFFIQRPWCKYLCPYGAFLGLFNVFRIKAIVRQEDSCIGCKKCDRSCPMNIEVSTSKVVRNHQCTSCLSCTSKEACPIDETLSLTGTKGIKEQVAINFSNVAAFTVAIVSLVVVGTTIGLSRTASASEDTEILIETSLDGDYESGTYEGVATGFNTGLSVEITIEDNQITDLTITDHNETIGYYETAFETIPSSIVTEQSTEVDVVSGATRSSEGIIEAVEMALESAASSTEASYKNVVEVVAQETETELEEVNEMVESSESQELTEDTAATIEEAEKVEVTTGSDISSVSSTSYKDGTYTGTGIGYGGEVVTEVTITDGCITKVEVTDNDETPLFLEKATAVIESIIATQSTEVDVVSGATLSSEAIIDGSNEALEGAK